MSSWRADWIAMKSNTCLFDGQEYIVWHGSDLFQAINKIPENFGVIPDYGRGTDAYRAIGIGIMIEGGDLYLNEIQVAAKGDCYFPIAGVAPMLPQGRTDSATYSNLSVKIEKTGSLILLKNQVSGRRCVSGWFGPGDFEEILELEFIGGKLLQAIGTPDSLAENRNLLAHALLKNVDQSKWSELATWMRECYFVERTPEDHKGYWSAIKAGESILNCQTRFPGVRKRQWSDREMHMVASAAQGNIPQQDAFELLCLLETAREMRHNEEGEFAVDELLMRGWPFWKDVEVWMVAEVERWPPSLHAIVRRLAGSDIEFDSDVTKLLPALVDQFEASGNRNNDEPIELPSIATAPNTK
jgi:hypothetical protein